MRFLKNKNNSKPACFICYTVKGFGLPLAGHKDNHSGIMNMEQFKVYQNSMNIKLGKEWDKIEGIKVEEELFKKYLSNNSFYNTKKSRVFSDQYIKFKEKRLSFKNYTSTQDAFGVILNEIGKEKSNNIKRIITTSPDVTVSTNLGSWVNQRNIFSRNSKEDIFKTKNVKSAQKWKYSPHGQHIELGIAENNLFLLLGALGSAENIFGTRLIPVGTIYDTFIGRGLDALNYATSIDARFILVGTPSGITLSHEGGAHQSIITPNIGISQPNLNYYEPTFADELNTLLFWALNNIQDKNGSSSYFRLSTKKLIQPKRELVDSLRDDIVRGGYWFTSSTKNLDLVIICTGVIVSEVIKCLDILQEEGLNIGVFIAISPNALYRDWIKSIKTNNKNSYLEKKFANVNKETLS